MLNKGTLYLLHVINFLICVLQLDEEDFKEEQNTVARVINMLHNDKPEEMLKV